MRIIYKISKGIHKDNCEDSALVDTEILSVSEGIIENDSVEKICIGDGVGGNVGGNEASFFIMNKIAQMDKVSSIKDLKQKIVNLNDALIEYAKAIAGHELMATTLTGLFFIGERTYLVQCGNTRAYILQGNFLKQITQDHTTYQWLISTGNDKAAEACNKSEIRGALGGGNKKYVDAMEVNEIFERVIPKMILLTSDGIHDFLTVDEIEDILTNDNYSSKEIVKRLVSSAVEKGSTDDCTVLLIYT